MSAPDQCLDVKRAQSPGHLPELLRAEIAGFVRGQWPGYCDDGEWVYPDAYHPRHFVLTRGGRLVSHVSVLWKEEPWRGEPLRLHGLGHLFTVAEERGRGHARHLVQIATSHIAAAAGDLALLTCPAYLRAFYEGSGWAALPRLRLSHEVRGRVVLTRELPMIQRLSDRGAQVTESLVDGAFEFGGRLW